MHMPTELRNELVVGAEIMKEQQAKPAQHCFGQYILSSLASATNIVGVSNIKAGSEVSASDMISSSNKEV